MITVTIIIIIIIIIIILIIIYNLDVLGHQAISTYLLSCKVFN